MTSIQPFGPCLSRLRTSGPLPHGKSWGTLSPYLCVDGLGMRINNRRDPFGFLFKGAEDRLPRPVIHTHLYLLLIAAPSTWNLESLTSSTL